MSNKLKYVRVYDRIFEMIKDGIFPPGSRLPSEMELSEQMNVSRMTLRKALALLQEDNLITNKNGIGSFVRKEEENGRKPESFGMEHPVYRCCREKPDSTELEYRIEIPTPSISTVLERRSAAVVIADRWYKKDEIPCVYSLSFIPIEVISGEGIDLNQKEDLLRYLEETVYRKGSSQSCSFAYSTAGNFTSMKYAISEKSSFILLQETLYDEKDMPLVVTKTYIPIELFKMEIHMEKNDHKTKK